MGSSSQTVYYKSGRTETVLDRNDEDGYDDRWAVNTG